jgi:hypothetical protein
MVQALWMSAFGLPSCNKVGGWNRIKVKEILRIVNLTFLIRYYFLPSISKAPKTSAEMGVSLCVTGKAKAGPVSLKPGGFWYLGKAQSIASSLRKIHAEINGLLTSVVVNRL